MILLTALHTILIGALLLGVAVLAAEVLRSRNRNERWIWAAALMGALALPPLLQALPRAPGFAPAPPGSTPVAGGGVRLTDLPELVVVPVASAPSWAEPLFLALWALASALLALRFLAGLWTLRRLRLRGRRVGGFALPIRRTRGVGPAIVGFVRPVILVPGWVLALPREERDWILRHEAEHLRGRDPLLLALVLVSRIAVPWNPVVWLLGRRLLAAIELDCDRRTLMAGPSKVRSYAEALLRVARRPDAHPPAAAFAFAEREPSLEERIRTMSTPPRPVPTTLRLTLSGLAVLVLAVACAVPVPSDSGATGADDAVVSEAEDSSSVQDGPVFTPMTQGPELTNGDEIRRAVVEAYPRDLREAGIGGTVKVWLYIDARGRVEEVRLAEGSGHPELDQAALEVAQSCEFEPALNRDEPVAVWVQFPVLFSPSVGG